MKIHHTRLHRLSRVHISDAVYFITVCTHERRPFLASADVFRILADEFAGARARHGWAVGRYVVMPDHVHFFCMEEKGGARHSLFRFMQQWKQWTAKRLVREGGLKAPVWQKQFFDHVLCSDESYAEKWTYVRENQVRAGLSGRDQRSRLQGRMVGRDQRSRLQFQFSGSCALWHGGVDRAAGVVE